MLSVKSADQIGGLADGLKPQALKPAALQPASKPFTPPAAPEPARMDKLEAAMLLIAAGQRDTAVAMHKLAQRPKTMEAEIIRNDDGRATKIIITVTERE